VIVGGIVFSLILTLFVIPAMYTFLSRRKPVSERINEEEEETTSVHA
jgi:multidrug efflux pump